MILEIIQSLANLSFLGFFVFAIYKYYDFFNYLPKWLHVVLIASVGASSVAGLLLHL